MFFHTSICAWPVQGNRRVRILWRHAFLQHHSAAVLTQPRTQQHPAALKSRRRSVR